MTFNDILKKYELPTLDEWQQAVDIHIYDNCSELYHLFLLKTDHIPNKIIEAQILNKEIDDNYIIILEHRQFARDEINRIAAEEMVG